MQFEDLKIDSEDGGGEWRLICEFSKSLSPEQTFNARQCRNKLSMPLLQSFPFFLTFVPSCLRLRLA